MFKKFTVVFLTVFILATNISMAATKQDVFSAIDKTYDVGGKDYRLPDKFAGKLKNYLNKKELSADKYDKLLSLINKAVGIAQKAGTTNVNEMTKENIKDGVVLLYEASDTLDIDLETELQKNNISIPQGKAESSVKPTPTPKPVDKNSDNGNGFSEVENNIDASNEEQTKETEQTEQIEGATEVEQFFDDDIDFSTIDKNFNKIMSIVIFIIIVIQIILFFIIVLIFRMKRHKIIKKILGVVFILFFVISVAAFILTLVYMKRLRTIYKLYYMFK